MKINYRQIDGFVKKPDPAARVILIYGPDAGLMKDRATKISKSIVEDITDPFNVAKISPEKITEDPALLESEANAVSMMGGARLVIIESANEKIVPALKSYLENPSPDNLVIIEAGELSPRSSLRKLCESAKNAAAIPCYIDDERALLGIIRTHLKEFHLTISNDACSWLAQNISGDRQKVLMELDKLATYMGVGTEHVSREISIDDVMACCGAAGARGFDDLVYSTAGGRTERALQAYNHLLEEGVPAIAIFRAMQTHFRRLHQASILVAEGLQPEQAMGKLTPPIFFKLQSDFESQMKKWKNEDILGTLTRLAQLEAESKKTGAPAETLCGQALLSISQKK
jgi:DNA polymerase-3 subunit delta